MDAFHPSFGPDGRIAYELGGDIDAAPVAPDGSADLAGEVQLVQAGESTPPDFTESPSYTGSNLAFVGGDAGNLEDIWVESVSPTGVTITSTVAAGADANELRLDLYYHCGGLNYPVSLGLRPDQVDGATATFHPIFDSSFACSGGTLQLFENDGFSRFDITSAGPIVALEGPDFPPVATINEARPGAKFLQYAPIALQGAGKDPTDGELAGAALHWTITDPDGVQTDLGTGTSIDLPNAALPFNGDGGHGWKTGTYRVSLTATDVGGRSDTATSSITVVGDENDDGLADSAETACGVSTTDPAAAFGDVDGDGLPNIDDPRLCAVDPKQETTPPTITLSHTGSLVPSVTETVSASDLDGGLRSVSCTVDGDPVTLPGEASLWASQTFSATFPVTGPGTHAVTCTATDTAYNSANATENVAVLYGFSGFLAPVNNPPTVNTGKAGRTYPVKFRLTDSTGHVIGDLSAVTDEKYKSVACGVFSNDPNDALETTATGGSTLRFDGGQFVYNWQTPSTKGCYVLYVLLADGSIRQANFQLS